MRRALHGSYLLLLAVSAASGAGAGAEVLDLAEVSTGTGVLQRIHGGAGDGSYGVPVAGGLDVDDDGQNDAAFAAMRANPLGRSNAGEVYLVFGDGTIAGTRDTTVAQPRILVIAGAHARENAGSEIWMDDVTGDGVGDLLVARQNHDAAGRAGAGALTILAGGPEVGEYAELLERLDLANAPDGLTLTTLLGAEIGSRLGIWVRTGDVDGDLVADIVVGADQEGNSHQGAAYVIRGGPHLGVGGSIDLADFGATALAGHLARIGPPGTGASEYHLGATVQIGDLDSNGRGEVLVAATLDRAGGSLQSNAGGSHGRGGANQGTLYIVWDDNFGSGSWPAGYGFTVDAAPGTGTSINGNAANRYFGEELLAGFDFDDDGAADLFVGDIEGDASPGAGRPGSGHGWVFYDAAELAGLDIDLGNPPSDLATSVILGAAAGDLCGDTATAGDFDGDGVADLAIASPHHDPLGRSNAGAFHVLHGQASGWPPVIDLASLPLPTEVRIRTLIGADGGSGSDAGDTLGYSAASGYMDADDRLDLIANEMLGDGLGGQPEDVGNLLIISGILVPEPDRSLLACAALTSLVALRRSARRVGASTDPGGGARCVRFAECARRVCGHRRASEPAPRPAIGHAPGRSEPRADRWRRSSNPLEFLALAGGRPQSALPPRHRSRRGCPADRPNGSRASC